MLAFSPAWSTKYDHLQVPSFTKLMYSGDGEEEGIPRVSGDTVVELDLVENEQGQCLHLFKRSQIQMNVSTLTTLTGNIITPGASVVGVNNLVLDQEGRSWCALTRRPQTC